MYQVIAFEGEPARVADFLAVPHRIYRGDPRWIPTFDAVDRRDMLGQHPLGAILERRHFLAMRQGAIVARATAFLNTAVHADGAPVGTVGNFEADNDPDAVRAMLEACFAWHRERGVKTVWGPMNGSLWTPNRFMIRGFDDMPFYGEPYNPPYYPELFAFAGFAPVKRWNSVFTDPAATRDMAEKTRPRHDAALAAGYRFRPIDIKKGFLTDLLELRRLVVDAFSGFTGFHEISEQAFVDLYGSIRGIAIPELIQFLHDPAGEIVGYLCMLPDFPRGIRAMRGRADWLGKLRFLLARGRPSSYVALYLGITRAEQARRSGAGGALAHLGCHLAARDGVTLVSALMAEGSFARAWSRGHVARTHEYELYQKSL
ncbi:MAG: hypothetical protein FJZ01_10800 [Candidatus Sericytochromatia bacterium]|nr:hypothetical protein [Candidatus Tanganyikabacteria bacterium]